MTTKELLDWVVRAEKWTEEHPPKNLDWETHKLRFGIALQAVLELCPENVCQVDYELALLLIRNYWNECQLWQDMM